MSTMNVIASFQHEDTAKICFRYASRRYPSVRIELSSYSWARYPFVLAMDPIGGEAQRAIAFIKGFAYALPRSESLVDEVMCKGDERDRYERTVT
jgi:hypothetical protein